MELRQLRYFLAVAEELHFGRAAQNLHMSQPPLSLQISRLEQELGVQLLERSTRQVALTPAGEHLQSRARTILAALDAVGEELREYADGASGSLSVGFVSSANHTVLPGLIQRFRDRRPGVALSLVPLTSAEQIERLIDGSLDVGILRDEEGNTSPGAGALHFEKVHEEPLVACVPKSHALARRPELEVRDLAGAPMVSYPRTLMPGYTRRLSELLGDTAEQIQVAEEVVHQETALGLVSAGAGITILPESIRPFTSPSIVVVPLRGEPKTRLFAAWHSRSQGGSLTLACAEYLHEAAAGLQNRRPRG